MDILRHISAHRTCIYPFVSALESLDVVLNALHALACHQWWLQCFLQVLLLVSSLVCLNRIDFLINHKACCILQRPLRDWILQVWVEISIDHASLTFVSLVLTISGSMSAILCAGLFWLFQSIQIVLAWKDNRINTGVKKVHPIIITIFKTIHQTNQE